MTSLVEARVRGEAELLRVCLLREGMREKGGVYIVMLMNSSVDDEYCMHGNHMTGFTTTWDY